MTTYTVEFTRRAEKEMEALNETYYTAIKSAIKLLAFNPRPAGVTKLKNRNGYRIRVSDYRVIYEIADETVRVLIVTIGHRREVYRQ